MDPHFGEMSRTTNSFIYNEDVLPTFDQPGGFNHDIQHDYLEFGVLDAPFPSASPIHNNFALSPNVSYDVGSLNDQDSDPVLKFLNQMLVEENLEDKPSMFHDPLALQATEKSLYEVIGQKYPHSPSNSVNYLTSNSPDVFSWNSADNPTSSNGGSNYIDPQWIIDPGESNSAVEQGPLQGFSSDSYFRASSQIYGGIASNSGNNANRPNTQMNFFEDANLLQNMFSDSETISLFKKGMEEASKFLPPSNQLILNLDQYSLPKKSDDISAPVASKVGQSANDDSHSVLKGRKHRYLEDDDSEDVERSSKQSAVYVDEAEELSKMFDGILLCDDSNRESEGSSGDANLQNGVEKTSRSSNGSDGGRALVKKNDSKDDSVDLSTLLIRCAESVTADDRRTAYAQLKQIRQHSSPTGDAYQRLANVFANGLQARLAGTGSELYAPLTQRRITAAEKIKAFLVYLSSCPFTKLSYYFADKMIALVASEATTLHVIDFGILYGFQWSVLIQMLSERPDGPPKLRITGIELPQPGFKPAERLEETGSRLASYCERLGVPFEYKAIAAQNWEKINLDDLKIASGEMLAVTCLFRLDQFLDETVVDSPRDAFLNLIKKMKPDIFVNAVTSGSYGVPIFMTRFREALFHYSALFDMFDTTLPRDNPQRMDFEQDFYGREVINVIACEGAERVERPQTYKQWQARYRRAGFKPVPFDKEIMEKLKNKVKDGYHKDFLFDEDGNWMLQGWKGRIICGSSCWVPS